MSMIDKNNNYLFSAVRGIVVAIPNRPKCRRPPLLEHKATCNVSDPTKTNYEALKIKFEVF